MSTTKNNRRVVVTGMGWVTPLGHDIDGVWKRLMKSESGMGPITRFDARTFPTSFAAQVRDYDIAHFVKDARVHASAGLNSQFALGAASQAWRQSGLEGFAGLNRKRVGLYLGAGEGVLDFDNYAAANLAGWDDAQRKVDGVRWAATAHKVLEKMCEVEQEPNMPLAHLAREFGIRGPALNCLTACAASTQAIGEAF
ncbi:MAG: beta-ketoacyl synthase N-terminal-like domain-containing protein, partial [Planctomycetota bacterium]